MRKIVRLQAVHVLLQGADGFHQAALKVVADTHDLAGRFHLSRQIPLGSDKLIEGQSGHLYHTVIQHGFKAGVGLSSNRIFNLIQRVAQGNLRRHLGDGIAGCLGSKR